MKSAPPLKYVSVPDTGLVITAAWQRWVLAQLILKKTGRIVHFPAGNVGVVNSR